MEGTEVVEEKELGKRKLSPPKPKKEKDTWMPDEWAKGPEEKKDD